MSFISSIIIPILEKELSVFSPELEKFILKLFANMAQEFIVYVEKKVGIIPCSVVTPTQSPPSAE